MDHHNAAVAEALLNDEGREGKRREEFERDFFPGKFTSHLFAFDKITKVPAVFFETFLV